MLNVNLNPDAPNEVFAKIAEILDAAVARKGKDYVRVVGSIYSLAALCDLDPRFAPLGEQLFEGLEGLLKDPGMATDMVNDFNMLVRINMDAVEQFNRMKGKKNEPPST